MTLAARQHGVVARAQLVRAGVPEHRIEYRLKEGRIEAVHRGVYRVGPVAGGHGKQMAAVLACGETALISHRSAGAIWRVVPDSARAGAGPVDVSIQRGGRRTGAGIRVHRVAPLGADEATSVDGLPITTPPRTLLDLASCLGPRDLERALARATRRGLTDRDRIERLLARYPRRRGTRQLRAVLAREAGPALTRSEAEARFLELIRKARLRAPEANVVVQGCEVDFLWRAERLVVEIDGFAFHSSPEAFERDRRRDIVLTTAGLRVIRVTWRQLTSEPEAVLAGVAQALVWIAGISPRRASAPRAARPGVG